jgi:NADPH:quinone reductase-like Zn-dependent oxidoreductase
MPLTTITAWELLFDRLDVEPNNPTNAGNLLIVGGVGGVRSILIQIARKLTGLTVIATASRPETKQWGLDLGAHHVINGPSYLSFLRARADLWNQMEGVDRGRVWRRY